MTLFVLNMPLTFKVGDTADCLINKAPACVTWRDNHTLVIEPEDARQIFHVETDDKMHCFFCGDARAKQAGVHTIPGGVIINQED
jgi:hypothetical protein